jgi:hypothetical protein
MGDVMDELTREMQMVDISPPYMGVPEDAPKPRRRRIRGLTLKRVPSGPMALQVGGGLAVGVGLYLLAGVAVTLLVVGVVAVALGALRESHII